MLGFDDRVCREGERCEMDEEEGHERQTERERVD